VKGEPAQIRAADFARVPQHGARIEPVGAGVGDDLAAGGIAQRHAGARARLPSAGRKALKLHCRHSPLAT
jgi:hypothetical protein